MSYSYISTSRCDPRSNALVSATSEARMHPNGQSINYGDKNFDVIKEGLAHILIPDDGELHKSPASNSVTSDKTKSVFYNPIQQFNRDLSVLAIRAFSEDLAFIRSEKTRSKTRHFARKRTTTGRKRKASEITSHLDGEAPLDAARNFVVEDVHTIDKETEQSLYNELSQPDQAGDLPAKSRPENVPKLRILDALSATGLRALRYAREIPHVSSVTANDLSKDATDLIKLNVESNNLKDIISITTGDALSHMYSVAAQTDGLHHNGNAKYDVIDLDPYGTAVPFLDASIRSLNDGGLLCVTCTDAAIWASCGYPEKTFSLYGGTPIKGLHSHEGGLRLILHSIASTAARYGMSMEPLMSLSIDFYARVFVRIFKSPAEVKMLAGKTMLVYSCDSGCGAWELQYLGRNQHRSDQNGMTSYKHGLAQGPSSNTNCGYCGSKTHISGPMYGGLLHNNAFLQRLIGYISDLDDGVYSTKARMKGMLQTALEESLELPAALTEHVEENSKGDLRPVPRMDAAEIDTHPFFFLPSALAKVIHCTAPPETALRGALVAAGFKVTRSHIKAGSVKTNAPWSYIWKVMREWMRQKAPVNRTKVKMDSPGWRLLQSAEATSSTNEADEAGGGINFDSLLEPKRRKERLVRYQLNPRPNWGPMTRARGY